MHQLCSCDVQLSSCTPYSRPVSWALLQAAAWAEAQHPVAVAACRSFYGDPIPGHVLAERLATYSHLFNLYWSVAGAGEMPCRTGHLESCALAPEAGRSVCAAGWLRCVLLPYNSHVAMVHSHPASAPQVCAALWHVHTQCTLVVTLATFPSQLLFLCRFTKQVCAALWRVHAAGQLRQGGAAAVPGGPRRHHARELCISTIFVLA